MDAEWLLGSGKPWMGSDERHCYGFSTCSEWCTPWEVKIPLRILYLGWRPPTEFFWCFRRRFTCRCRKSARRWGFLATVDEYLENKTHWKDSSAQEGRPAVFGENHLSGKGWGIYLKSGGEWGIHDRDHRGHIDMQHGWWTAMVLCAVWRPLNVSGSIAQFAEPVFGFFRVGAKGTAKWRRGVEPCF